MKNFNFIIIIFLIFLNNVIAKNNLPTKFKSAKSWLYQLQNINFNEVKNSYYDIIVTDYSWDGTAEKEYKAGQIKRLKKLTGKIVISYLSIGEAENYRFYWQGNWSRKFPSFIVRENPNWKGNYLVKFWDKKWQKIIFKYLDKIINEGFDGVYLDIVESYQYFNRKDSKKLMINFVKKIKKYGIKKKGKGNFLIIPQNAPELVAEKKYMNIIDGIAQEETYFKAMDIPSDDTDYNEKYLDMVINAGKKVLCAEYTLIPKNIEFVYKKCIKKNYIPYCTAVDLDKLIPNYIYYKKFIMRSKK